MLSLDFAIIVILAAFFLIGLVRGFIVQIGFIVGFFVALWVANGYHSYIATLLKPSLDQWPLIAGPASIVVGYILLFWVSQFLFGVLIKLFDLFLRRITIAKFLNMTNRLGGAAVGVVEGILFLAAIIFLATSLPLSTEWRKAFDTSFFAPKIKNVSVILTPFLPDMPQYSKDLLKDLPIDPNKLPLDTLKNLDLKSVGKEVKDMDLSQLQKLLEEYEKLQEKGK